MDVILAFMGEEAILSGEAHCLTDITLKGDQRVTLAPGKTTEVIFEFNIQDLAFYGKDMIKKVEPGKYQAWIAGNSASGKPVEFIVK